MGLTLAEAFILLAFALLLLFAFWQSETEKENTRDVQAFRSLPSDLRQAIASASRDGSVEAFIELKRQGLDFTRLEESLENPEDIWRFIDRDEVRRLLHAASRLPEDMQRDLADMVESERAHDVLREMAILEEVVAKGRHIDLGVLVDSLARTDRGPEDLLSAVRIVEALEESGSSADDLETLVATMVEDGRTVGEVTGMLHGQDDIFGRLKDHENRKATLVEALKDELGTMVSGMEGRIDASGAIIVPDTVLFESGKADITEKLARFLSQFCVPWLNVLMEANVEISEARIEGHASSEWRSTSAPHDAYLNNLDLSQRRAQVVLRYCLGEVEDHEIRTWARSRLVAVGYSSARPVMEDGREDRVASRRVVFGVVPDPEALIDTVGRELRKRGDVR